uniref:ELMO domain-containing protein n=1 Tax=Panagrolaimus sp. ES5 TaxID=591445 RepID=A0AC34FWR7_9BILA
MSALFEMMGNLAYSIQNFIFEGLLMITNFLTRSTRIERIMYQKKASQSTKVVQIEEALRKHENERLREFAWSSGDETEVAHGLLPSIKDEDQRHDYKKMLARSMRQIRGYTKLCDEMYQKKASQSTKVVQIEEALRKHENERLREFAWSSGDETEVAHGLLPSIKDEDQRHDYKKMLARSMRQIRGYTKLCDEVEARRSIPYDSKNESHEKLLLKLWNLLKPDEELTSRKSNQWQDIGFQQKFVVHLTEYLRRGSANLFEATLDDLI